MDPKAMGVRFHDPAYGDRVGHVYQVWEDGEITSQKSGPLLWQRTLHCYRPGNPEVNVPMPVPYGKHSYAMVNGRSEAEILSDAILSTAAQ